jgi:integrase
MRPITLHEARHSFASLLIDAGTNVKAIQTYMGHAYISITLDRYGHLLPGNRDEVRELMDKYLASCASGAPVTSPSERFTAVSDSADREEIPHS